MPEFDGVLNRARRLGIDECEVSAVERRTTTVRITGSEIAELKQSGEECFGARVIHRKRISSYRTCDEGDLEGAVEGLLRAPGSRERGFWQRLPQEIGGAGPLEGTFDRRLERISGAGAADIAQEMINSALGGGAGSVSGSLNVVSEKFEICNSNGLRGSDRATYISAMVDAESGEEHASGMGHQCCRTLDAFSAETVGLDSGDMCAGSANPARCEGGRYTLILEPYSVGELLAFVAAPNFGLKAFSEGRSCFAGMLGRQVADARLSLVDDPHAPQGIGTKPFDDEGVGTGRNTLIGGGVLRNVFSNLYDGFRDGKGSTGNAARPGLPMGRSADPVPVSAPHNLRIEAGDQSVGELVGETRRGLLVGRLWYTYALNPIRGDFSCTARSGTRIIENGEITGPGKPVRIIHSLPAMLRGVSGVGREARNVMQWASSPSIAPAVRFEGVPAEPI